MKPTILAVLAASLLVAGVVACGKKATPASGAAVPTYDKATGKLTRLSIDANKNGTIDTWTVMDGAIPIRTEQDQGVVYLIDDRFDQPGVRALLPRWWRVERINASSP